MTFNGRHDNNIVATGLMIMAVAFFALIPLVISIGDATNPFLISSALRAGMVSFCVLVLTIFFWRALWQEGVLGYIKRRIISREILLVLIGHFEVVLFALSLRWVEASVTAVLFETWPILLIFIVAKWTGGEFRRIDKQMFVFLLIAFVGVVFVFTSQHGGLEELLNIGPDDASPQVYIGVFLALASAFLAALAGFGWVWSSKAKSDAELPDSLKNSVSENRLEIFFLLVGFTMTSGVSAVIHGIIGASTGGIHFEIGVFEQLSIALLGGVIIGCGNVLWRLATAMTLDTGIHAMSYFTPVASVLILFAAGRAGNLTVEYFLIGTMAIVVANLLIRFEAEIRIGFKVLIISLVACGAIVSLREGAFDFLGVSTWKWPGSGYFESITLAATVFTLLLAFRVGRLVSRTSEEDSRTFIVYRKVDMLVRRGVIDPQVCETILEMDRANKNSAAEKSAYAGVRSFIDRVNPGPLNEADAQLLSDAEAQLDALVRSKQVDIHLGEMFALFIFAFVTVGIALFTLPAQVTGWTRVIVDLFALTISSVAIFLLSHIQDLQRERDQEKFELMEIDCTKEKRFAARFLDTGQRPFDQWLSIVVGGAIVMTFAGLLVHKWLG